MFYLDMSRKMNNLQTVISWTLNDYCKAQCEYCPINARGGGLPRETQEYLRITELLIDWYAVKQGRKLKWIFNGGEPLDMDGTVQILKLCKQSSEHITLHTNGGSLWMDWWAITPYVDNLILTFHFWQNPNLIKFIKDTFASKEKSFHITAPIRPKHVYEDVERVVALEDELGILIRKTHLYFNADPTAGMLEYSKDELRHITFYNLPKDRRVVKEPTPPAPPVESPLVKEKVYFQQTTWDQRYKDTHNKNPSFAGQLCNAGIERLNIGAQGWVSGSNCNNISLGNIWHAGWMPPQGPQTCGMISCVNEDDKKITKFQRHDPAAESC